MRDLQTPVAGFRSPFGALSQTGTAAFTQFGVRPHFVMDTPKNKYLTSKPERSDNLSELMTSVALGNATVIDKGGALKWRLHNLFLNSATGATQSITVVSGVAHTIRFKGTGSIIYSGAAAGTLTGTGANDIARVDVTAGSATLTCTVSGSITVVGVYRNDLGGMQLNSKDGTDYLPTSGAAGYALRRDYSRDTVNGEILGEPAGVNGIRNNTMQGAVVGVVSGAGSLPDNWFVAGIAASAQEVVAIGVEDGLTYIDFRLNGTPTGNISIALEGSSAISAATGEVFTSSFWIKEQAGSQTNITGFLTRQYEYASSSFVSDQNIALSVTATRARQQYTVTMQEATVTHTQPRIGILWAGAGAIDITMRVYMPQDEEYHVATSVIPTYGASEARAKDEALCIIADKIPGFIQGSGSLVFEGSIDYETGGSGSYRVAQIDDGSADNRVSMLILEGDAVARTHFRAGNSVQANIDAAIVSGSDLKIAMRWGSNDFAGSGNGGAADTDTSGTPPTGLTVIRLGDIGAGLEVPIRISHLSIGPYASPVASPGWSNAQLAVISGS
jgi:hypothetical protein